MTETASKRPADLLDHLGYWVRLLANQVSHGLAARLERFDVTVAEWVILRSLYHRPPQLPSALADELDVSRPTISKLADRLVAKGYVERREDTDDRRRLQLTLSAEGESLVPELCARADANDEAFFGDLSPAERAEFEATLTRLVVRARRSHPVDSTR